MAESRSQQAEVAYMAAVIERAGDLALWEEPARFIQALETAADGTERPS
jgi:hypothetical protein